MSLQQVIPLKLPEEPRPPIHDPFAVINALSDAVIVVDLDGRIQQANRATCAWAGLDAGSIQGRLCHDIFSCIPAGSLAVIRVMASALAA